MNKKPLISVIMPVYNVGDFIKNSVQSVIRQTYPNIEIIVVNDGSQDLSIEIARNVLIEWGGNYRIINQENLGLGEARNTGLKVATGDWVCFFDSDDILSDNALEDMIYVALKNNADVVFSDYNDISTVNDAVFKCQRGSFIVFNKDEIQSAFLKRTLVILAPGTMYNRSFLQNNSLKFNKIAWSEDQYFMWQVLLYANKVVYLKEKLYQYLKRQGSIMNYTKIGVLIDSYHHFFNIENEYSSNKIVGPFILPRWTMGTLNSAARMYEYKEWKKLLIDLEIKKNFKRLLFFSDIKIRSMACLCLCIPKLYYILNKYRKR